MEDNIRRFPAGRRPSEKNTARPVYIDIGLIFCVFVLVVIGLIMIYSTSAYDAGVQFGDVAFYLKKQIFAVSIGIVAMIFTMLYPYKRYGRLAYAALGVAFVFIMLIFTPLAYSANGATRWIKIAGISLQPAEVVKVAIIIYMSQYLSRRNVNVNTIKGILRALLVPFVYSGMVVLFTSNLSSAIIIGAIAFVMIFIRSKNYKLFAGTMLVIIFVGLIVVLGVKNADNLGWDFGYRGDRIKAWLDPTAYASDEGYQTLQSLYAIGSGGLMGKGIGESIQKLRSIPEAQNDMIFAIICEELGFVGAFFVVIIFGILITRCRYIALRATDLFGSLLAVGVMAHIAIQVILNLAVVTNTMPNTGISLPFISYGGTSIVFLMAEMGMVINVGKSIRVE